MCSFPFIILEVEIVFGIFQNAGGFVEEIVAEREAAVRDFRPRGVGAGVVAAKRVPPFVVLMAVRFDDADLDARQRRDAGREGFVPIDLDGTDRQIRAEHRNMRLVSDFRDLQRHAERLRYWLQRDGAVAKLDALFDIVVAMRAFIGGDTNAQIADICLIVFGERLLHDGDLVERTDLLAMVQEALQTFFGIIAAVGVEVIGDFAVFRVGRRAAANGLVDGGDALHVPLEHLFAVAVVVRIGSDFDFHEEIAFIDMADDFLHGNGVGHQRDGGDLTMAIGEDGAETFGNHFVERFEAVFAGVEDPCGGIDADERVEGERQPQIRLARDAFPVLPDIRKQLIQKVQRRFKGFSLRALEGEFRHGEHEGVAGGFRMGGEDVRVRPKDALAVEADGADAIGGFKTRDGLPDFAHVAAFETERADERLALKIRGDVLDGDHGYEPFYMVSVKVRTAYFVCGYFCLNLMSLVFFEAIVVMR